MAGRPGVQWETDGTHWLVMSTTHRNTLAVFSIPDAGFSSSNVGCTPLGGGGVWSGEMLSPDSPSAALAVCSTSLVSVSKLDKGTGSKVRVRHLTIATKLSHAETSCRTSEEILSVCWMSPSAPCSRDLSSNRLACGTGGGEIIIFNLGPRRLEEVMRISPAGRGLSRIEGLRLNSPLNLLAVMEYRHGTAGKGGDLRVWVCDMGCRGGGEELRWSCVAAPKVGDLTSDSVDGGGKKTSKKQGETLCLCDMCWHEESVLLLHRAGSASLHLSVPTPLHVASAQRDVSATAEHSACTDVSSQHAVLQDKCAHSGSDRGGTDTWRMYCTIQSPPASFGGGSNIASLSGPAWTSEGDIGQAGAGKVRDAGGVGGGGGRGGVAVAGESAFVHVHSPLVW